MNSGRGVDRSIIEALGKILDDQKPTYPKAGDCDQQKLARQFRLLMAGCRCAADAARSRGHRGGWGGSGKKLRSGQVQRRCGRLLLKTDNAHFNNVE